MMRDVLVGRKNELRILSEIEMAVTPEFVAIYGRRRVGKTYLVSKFFKDKGVYFELTGRKDASKSSQLQNFAIVFADTFCEGKQQAIPRNWDEALTQLRYQLEKVNKSSKIILFFDELPWLASKRSGFLEALDLFWNRYISRRSNVVLIVCGSAAEWMIKKVVSNKSGLHNRLTRPPINLAPFNLGETELYLQSRGVHLDRKQIVDIYMAIGGVAYYLNLVPKGQSSLGIVSNLFFVDQAPLYAEFHRLFSSLYDNPERHLDVIKALAKVRQGLSQTELFKRARSLSPGGSAVAVLQELESCGFILSIPQFGKKKKDTFYRLIDAFSLFYLKWVEGAKGMSPSYWAQKKMSQSYKTWAGYEFENICFQHYSQIVKAMDLRVVASAKSGWRGDGAQIDLIIDRADRCINLCEIKFVESQLALSKIDADALRRKKQAFQAQTGTKKALFTTVITTCGVKEDKNYLSAVDQQIKIDALFE